MKSTFPVKSNFETTLSKLAAILEEVCLPEKRMHAKRHDIVTKFPF